MRRRWGEKTPRACVRHGALRAAFSDLVLRDEAFFLIPAVAVGAAGGEGVACVRIAGGFQKAAVGVRRERPLEVRAGLADGAGDAVGAALLRAVRVGGEDEAATTCRRFLPYRSAAERGKSVPPPTRKEEYKI